MLHASKLRGNILPASGCFLAWGNCRVSEWRGELAGMGSVWRGRGGHGLMQQKEEVVWCWGGWFNQKWPSSLKKVLNSVLWAGVSNNITIFRDLWLFVWVLFCLLLWCWLIWGFSFLFLLVVDFCFFFFLFSFIFYFLPWWPSQNIFC